MAKIFAAQAELNNHPSRNNFDLSHKIHMTGKMGLLYPVLCKPVVPGDSFRIDSGCAFNFMPMPYPTQTRMRFIQHFFYVRNKNLWKNWQNWLQGLEEHVPPYIDHPASYYRTGSLADFLGIPTTVKSSKYLTKLLLGSLLRIQSPATFRYLYGLSVAGMVSTDSELTESYESMAHNHYFYPELINGDFSRVSRLKAFSVLHTNYITECGSSGTGLLDGNNWRNPAGGSRIGLTRVMEIPRFVVRPDDTGGLTFMLYNPLVVENGGKIEVGLWMRKPDVLDDDGFLVYKSRWTSDKDGTQRDFKLTSEQVDLINALFSRFSDCRLYLTVTSYLSSVALSWNSQCVVGADNLSSWPIDVRTAAEIDSVEGANPYYSSVNTSDDTVRVSALPFRAYESIYNAFYRNQHGNQPFKVDGVTKYNQYITTDEDGADSTQYDLYRRNWELDAYTSCLPSPQQGPAPVVGITALGKVTIVDPETGVTTTAQATDTPNGMQFTDVSIGEASHQQYLVNLASSGITINDFRQVNSLQRFLETNIRKGFRYVDFIEGHFGQRIKDAVMDMPEFIGGFSQTVDVNMISNTTAQEIDKVQQLGSYGGQASAFGGTQHTINHYCDDYGWIIGILCLVPEPSYSQILPKHFNIKQPLDFYFPEFAQIGLQPITYEEFCPVQSKLDSVGDDTKKLTDVFGYQRPNHDMVWYPDTLHGEFRKTFSDYIVNRMFSKRPELGNDFLTIKPEETNSIFNYTAPDEDVFVGQLAFSIKAKRPVPRIVVPSLGR